MTIHSPLNGRRISPNQPTKLENYDQICQHHFAPKTRRAVQLETPVPLWDDRGEKTKETEFMPNK